jgi:hydroxymethylbilane synthase
MVRIATRKSPLALAQSEMVAAVLRSSLGLDAELLRVVTTGDRQAAWSLEKAGGKGLFTAELEQHLLKGDALLAVHSAKDLPGSMTAGLALAGYLPRADPRDVLVTGPGFTRSDPVIATSSPRRRMQLALAHPGARFTEIRGNVDTRLRKIADGLADATVLAAAGLARLGIGAWPGLEFHPLDFSAMVPAVGQAAIAVQCRAEDAGRFAGILDLPTARAVSLERALQERLGGGCQTAFGAHVAGTVLHLFHERTGIRTHPLAEADLDRPDLAAGRILESLLS